MFVLWSIHSKKFIDSLKYLFGIFYVQSSEELVVNMKVIKDFTFMKQIQQGDRQQICMDYQIVINVEKNETR